MEITKNGGRRKANNRIEKWTRDMTRQLTERRTVLTLKKKKKKNSQTDSYSEKYKLKLCQITLTTFEAILFQKHCGGTGIQYCFLALFCKKSKGLEMST